MNRLYPSFFTDICVLLLGLCLDPYLARVSVWLPSGKYYGDTINIFYDG